MLYKRFVGDLIASDFMISLKRSYKVTWYDINSFRHVSMNKREKHEVEWSEEEKNRLERYK